jgi:UDP-GlcNAc3NAcA epimerase
MLRRLEPIVTEHEPDGVLIYGDTNSTLAAAVVASKTIYADRRRPWLAHVEAGLRSFNPAMPEERNRIVADHLADLLLAPTPAAMENLAREGLAARGAAVGDVMVDAFRWAEPRSEARLPEIARDRPGYLLVTLHRAENVDDPRRLATLLGALALDRPVLLPMHPRTRAAVASGGVALPGNVEVLEPVGYLAMIALERHAAAIATDSGGVQKEAYLAGVPCITLRSETEWVETVESGWNRVIGNAPDQLRELLRDASFMDRGRPRPDLFGDGRAAERIVAALGEMQQRHGGAGDASPSRAAEGARA